MAANILPTPETLRNLLAYDPDTGTLTWVGDENHARVAGRPALTALTRPDRLGYRHGSVSGAKCRAHRVAWAIYYGRWPKGQIDHINGDRLDNRICNLRDVTASENCKNVRLRANNTSGVVGVTWDKGRRKWKAKIVVNHRTIHLGDFATVAEAAEIRRAAEIRYGFHPNHGKPRESFAGTA